MSSQITPCQENLRVSSTQNYTTGSNPTKKATEDCCTLCGSRHFKDSDHHKWYFCYNCEYFVKPHYCAIVTDVGMDILGRSSGVIPPHALCSLWLPNEKEIHGDSSYRGAGTEVSIKSES